MTSASESRLPSDCWRRVMDFLPWDDLLPLLLVSRHLRDSVVPSIYHTISWNWDPVPARKILLFLRTILDRPELALHVQRVSLLSSKSLTTRAPWRPPECDFNCRNVAMFNHVLQQARSIVRDAKFPDAHFWIQALENGDIYAFVAILLSQLHGLRSLRLDYSFVWMSGFPGLMLQHALFSTTNGPLSAFNSLTEVDYGSNVRCAPIIDDVEELYAAEGYPHCNRHQFSAWFYLPSLRSLAIWLRTDQIVTVPGRQPNFAQLQSIVLTRSTIREDQVQNLLSQTTCLDTLHLGLAYKWGHEVALENGYAILQGLGAVSNTISNLSIGLEYYPPNMGDCYMRMGERKFTTPFRGFLIPFANVQYAEIPITLLAGWNTQRAADLTSVLPSPLLELCLRVDFGGLFGNDWDESSLLDYLARNVPTLRTHMPNLKRVYLRLWRELDRARLEQKREDIRSICQQKGIGLAVIYDDLSIGLRMQSSSPPEQIAL